MDLVCGETHTATVTAAIREGVDVLVAGGGTAGVVAAIAAARGGAKVVLVERHHFLGGMMTGGNAGLTLYTVYDKRQAEYRRIISQLAVSPEAVQIVGGIPMEITRRLLDEGAAVGTAGTAGSYVFTAQEDFKYLLLAMMRESGLQLLLHSLVVDVVRENATLKGIVVEGKSGREVLPAKVVVDATGDGDVAARAGVPFVIGAGPDGPRGGDGKATEAMADMGVMFRMANVNIERLFAHLREHPEHYEIQSVALMTLDEACQSHRKGEMACFCMRAGGLVYQVNNSPIPGVVTLAWPCFTGSGLDTDELTAGELALIDDVRGRVSTLRGTLPGFEESFLLDMPEIGVRETRHIRGDHVLTIEDILTRADFPDTIGRGAHPIDISPLPEHLKNAATVENWYFNIPYRCLIARGIDNLLVAGRCISATHEASGCTRPTVQCMVTGQAAGTAAALCATGGFGPRELDIHILRSKLSEGSAIF